MNDERRRRFPDMTPITAPPSLASINGIGTQLNGRRDFDADTGTYVATQTFAVVFVPLIAVGAYRVADAPSGGWYFVGRVPYLATTALTDYFARRMAGRADAAAVFDDLRKAGVALPAPR